VTCWRAKKMRIINKKDTVKHKTAARCGDTPSGRLWECAGKRI